MFGEIIKAFESEFVKLRRGSGSTACRYISRLAFFGISGEPFLEPRESEKVEAAAASLHADFPRFRLGRFFGRAILRTPIGIRHGGSLEDLSKGTKDFTPLEERRVSRAFPPVGASLTQPSVHEGEA